MSFKDILVHLDAVEGPCRPLEAALQLGRGHSTHIIGLHVSAPVITAAAAPEIYPQVYQMLQEIADRETQDTKRAFLSRMEKESLPSEFRHEDGDPLNVIAEHGRFADLIVVSQPDPDAVFQTLAHELAIVAGRPIMVVPRFVQPKSIGTNVLVAWNGRKEAARAIGDSMPLLVRAQQVQVLTISTSGKSAKEDALAAADMAAHLARHGVKAEARQTVAEEIDVANLVLSTAADLGSDLLVMGAYGHSRFREIVLGGATRDILNSPTIPVLLSH